MDKAAVKRDERVRKSRIAVRNKRRFASNFAPSGDVRRMADATATGSIFPHSVKTWPPGPGEKSESILKCGGLNAKIGANVLVGALKGARIFTLTLEERATCPKSCGLWRECYGNGMQWARRWSPSPAWEKALTCEVARACATHAKVLIRLHVLGDFYSFKYLRLWVELLDQHENLSVFGFTAWRPNTKIGRGIARVRSALGMRFCVRNSGFTGKWGAFTIDFPTRKGMLGDAVVCPEQRGAIGDISDTKHCGNCGACWRSSAPIAFILHG